MKVIGSFVSPYVRKVLVCLELKGLDYQVDPITPFYGNDEFERLSPLRRIPVLIDGDVELCDSTVICAYLEDAYPDPPLLPPRSQRPGAGALARGVRRHAARRRVHLGAVLPARRPPVGVGRTGRCCPNRQDAGRGRPGGARLS